MTPAINVLDTTGAVDIGVAPDKTIAAPSFDYSALQPELAADLRSCEARIRHRGVKQSKALIQDGRDLRFAKETLTRAEYRDWIATLEIEAWDAQRAIRAAKLAERVDDKLLSQLTVSALHTVAAASTPTAVQDDVMARLADGDVVRHKEILALIEAARPGEDKEARRKQAEAAARALLRDMGVAQVRKVIEAIDQTPMVLDCLRRRIRRPKLRKPVSLLPYLLSRGGLKETADLRYIFGKVRWPFRANGMSMHRARQAAVEGGYLSSEEQTHDLQNLIAAEAHGRKAYPMGEEPMFGGAFEEREDDEMQQHQPDQPDLDDDAEGDEHGAAA